MVYEIGDKISFVRNTTGETVQAEVTGRNWWFERVLSYVVRIDGVDILVNAESMKSEFSWY